MVIPSLNFLILSRNEEIDQLASLIELLDFI